ncbi:putative tuftelin-interacting protein [Cryptosporidium canis]|uniref:Tuftelin-interacting protein n=1 Tax=Cryptosporidium canis TaxID=195482 RepID=A0ABQ8P2J2_9CRYT|nr:putative tuftelin-interacting protein [Cryptosporidium canis]
MKESRESEDLRAKYGKGFDLIKKLGFKGGGLGVDGSGISEPIQVRVRPANLGITGEGGVHSEAPVGVSLGSRSLDERSKRQRTGKVLEASGEMERPKPDLGPEFPKKAYLDDIMESVSIQRELHSGEKRECRESLVERQLEIDNLGELLKGLAEKKLILENLGTVTRQIQRAFLKFHHDLERVTEDEITTLFEAEQSDSPSNEGESCQDQIDRLEGLVSEFSASLGQILGSCGDPSSREVCKSYLPYCSMVKSMLRPTLQSLYNRERDMRLDPDFGVSTWISIKGLFVFLQTSRKEKDYDSKLCFEQLVTETLGKYLETYFVCSWDPIRENEYGISLLSIWINLIPPEFIKTSIIKAVWNKQIHQLQLNKMVSESGSAHSNSKYKWLFQWLPYYFKFGMGYQVSRVISRHIDSALEEWEPPEEWPLSLLTLWKPILETQRSHETDELDALGLGCETRPSSLTSQELSSIILTSIYPKLLAYFSARFSVEQSHRLQQLECIDHLDLWFKSELIDKSLASQILTDQVGPKWIKALEIKLSNIRLEYRSAKDRAPESPDSDTGARLAALYGDLLEWYQFWRTVLSTGVFASAKSKAFLARGLLYIDYHVNFHSDLAPELKRTSDDWVDYGSHRDQDDEIPELQDLNDDSLILGVLEWVSDETGLVLRQSGRNSPHGRQIFSVEYGEQSVESGKKARSSYFRLEPVGIKLFFYVNQGVIFVRDSGTQREGSDTSGDWTPVSVPGMLARLGIWEQS